MRKQGGRGLLPRRTVRLRLTALYGALFLASGAGLLAITNLLARSWPWSPLPVKAPPGGSRHNWPAIPALPAAYQHQVIAYFHQLAAYQMQLSVQSASQHAAALNQLLTGSAIALGVMAVASVALGWLVAGRVLRPLETAFDAQRRFAANASHELRTPLTMMRTSLDVATAKPAPIPPELTVLARKLREGLDQADRLMESLLLLARVQHGAKDGHETMSLRQLLCDAIDDRADLIARTSVHLQQGAADGWVTGNPDLLARMAGNLLDNATRHNQPGGWISAETSSNGRVTRLVVENGGPILDQDTVASLTEPFRRLGTDRTGSADGAGLGLSIVEAIASAHGGVLRLSARPEGGLRAAVELPAASGALTSTRPAVLEAVR